MASHNRLAERRHDDDRVINYRLAHFLRLHRGKFIENNAPIDSFDAVEQELGGPLAQHGAGTVEPQGNQVAQ